MTREVSQALLDQLVMLSAVSIQRLTCQLYTLNGITNSNDWTE
jgi:hypothetical protein